MFKIQNLIAALMVSLLLESLGCAPANQYQPPPPSAVTVARPIRRSVTVYLEETGTTEAVDLAEVRARVRGFLDEIKFEPGKDVQEGQVLYQIEPARYRAAVEAAEAGLAARRVELEKAEIEFSRQDSLFKQDATAETSLVAARAARDEASAAIQAAQANLDQANLELSYTQVVAPISGRVGKTLVKKGNLVDGSDATHLTTVIQHDPIYANFNISESQLLSLMQSISEQGKQSSDYKSKLYLRRANDVGFPFEGEFEYADLEVDQSAGTFMIRGVFPNAEKKIVPGLFVRVRIPISVQDNAMLVPEYAVARDQAGQYVLVVDSKDIVQRRDVTVGPKQIFQSRPFVVIESGLTDADRVVINGLQRARPDAKVAPVETDLNAELAAMDEASADESTPLAHGNAADANAS